MIEVHRKPGKALLLSGLKDPSCDEAPAGPGIIQRSVVARIEEVDLVHGVDGEEAAGAHPGHTLPTVVPLPMHTWEVTPGNKPPKIPQYSNLNGV